MASTSNKRVQSNQDTKKGAPFRTSREGIVPNQIGDLHRLTLDAAMKAALTYAGAKLVIEIDAAGTRVLLADSRSNQLIGGPEDLQKLGSIRSFVNRERKEATGVESAKETTQLAYLVQTLVKDRNAAFEMRPVDTSFGAAMRPLKTALDQLIENEKRVDENTSIDGRALFEPEFKRLFHGAQNAYMDVIQALVEGRSIKGLLSENLFARGVPDWVHARITSKTFSLGVTEGLGKFFFPGDPIKGLALSAKEWRTSTFMKDQKVLTHASQLVYTLINDDELVRAITGIAADISLEDEENPVVSKMLKTKLVVMPLLADASQVISMGSKVRSGFKFPNPGMDTVTGAIVALSTAVLRVYAANLQSVDLVEEYYSTIVPGAVKREDVTPTNNFYVQWGKARDHSRVWIDAVRGAPLDLNLRQKVWRWLRTELRLSEKAKAGKALALALSLEDNGNVPTKGHTNGKINNVDSPEGELLTLLEFPDGNPTMEASTAPAISRELTAIEIPLWMEFQERVFRPRVGRKRQPVGLSLTPLTPQGKQLLMRVKQLSPYVAERMHSWLRSYSDERLQLAAVKVANAEFDDMFSSSLNDEKEAESVLDWAETEA